MTDEQPREVSAAPDAESRDRPPLAAAGRSAPGATSLPESWPFAGPIDIRSVALSGLFVLALIAALKIGKLLVMPIVLSIILSFLLTPLMRPMTRLRIPPPISAAILLFLLLGAAAYGGYRLSAPASKWMEDLPIVMAEVEAKLRGLQKPLEKIQEASAQVEEASERVADMAGGEDFTPRVITVDDASFTDFILSQTQAFFVTAAIVFVLLYLLLASGDMFMEKLVKVQRRFADKKRAVEIVRTIKRDISTYLFSITLINIALGICVAIAMFLLGMPNAALWGLMAAVLNFVPYVGALTGVVVIALASMVEHDTPLAILIVPTVYYALTALEGYLLTPIALGRRLTLNPVVIVIGLLFWSWVWGIPGALLAVPILVILKVVCDRIEPLTAIGEFLGR